MMLVGSVMDGDALQRDVAQKQFPWKNIGYVTNGIHHYTWVNNSIKTLFNEFFPNWQMEPEILRGVDKIDTNALWDAHFDAKTDLIHFWTYTVCLNRFKAHKQV